MVDTIAVAIGIATGRQQPLAVRSSVASVSHGLRRVVSAVWDQRAYLEAALLLGFALIAVVLEVLGVDDVRGRDPFRVLLPALVTLMAFVLLDVVAELRRIRPLV
jgi:hypothetical protein